MLIDESAKVEVCHIIHLNTRLTPRWFICLRPNYSSQMANSSQTHNLSLEYKFCHWFTKLFCNVMFDQMLIAIWFVVLPVISCGLIILRDKGWWEEGQKRERRDAPIVVANSNNSFHFLQGVLQILGNWFMIHFSFTDVFSKKRWVWVQRCMQTTNFLVKTLFCPRCSISSVPAGNHGTCIHQSIPSSCHVPLPPQIFCLALIFA